MMRAKAIEGGENQQSTAIDLEMTLANIGERIIFKANSITGQGHKFEDFTDSSFAKIAGVYRKEAPGFDEALVWGIYKKIWSEDYGSIPAIADRSRLEEVASRSHTEIVTFTPFEGQEKYKERWLELKYPELGIKMTPTKHGAAWRIGKGYDNYLDDDLEMLGEFLKAITISSNSQRTFFLVGWPYNKVEIAGVKNVVRSEDSAERTNHALDLLNQKLRRSATLEERVPASPVLESH